MNSDAQSLWIRAKDALKAGRYVLEVSPDTAASRAYYAAFYGVSAWFALEDQTFTKHSAVEAAVHRDLVRVGVWPEKLGEGYSRLVRLRNTADYGGPQRASVESAKDALETATEILRVLAAANSDTFTGLEEV